MYKDDDLQLSKQRMNALEIVNQWAVEINMKEVYDSTNKSRDLTNVYNESKTSNDFNEKSVD